MLRAAASSFARLSTLHPEGGEATGTGDGRVLDNRELAKLPVIGLSGRAWCVVLRHTVALTRYSDAGSLVGCVPGVSGRVFDV